MAEVVQIKMSQDLFILCHIFKCSIDQILQFYIDNIDVEKFAKKDCDNAIQTVTYFLLDFTPTRKAN